MKIQFPTSNDGAAHVTFATSEVILTRPNVRSCGWRAAASIILLSIGCVPSGNAGATPDDVDQYVQSEMKARGIPGLALAVLRGGRIVKLSGYGVATLDHDVPVDSHTVFSIASVDKQFTATAVMLLVEEGKVSIDAPLSRYLNESPPSWAGIQIRHLLTHTSGLGDVPEGADGRVSTRYTTRDLLRAIIVGAPDFPPGTRWQYSDAGYLLLQVVVERVTGMDYLQFLASRVLHPLAMTETRVLRPLEVRRHRATHYERDSTGKLQVYAFLLTDWDLWNDVGLSIADFAKWAAAMDSEKLLRPATFAQMWTPTVLQNGDTVAFHALTQSFDSYGFGWILGSFRGHTIISHAGFAGAAILRLPDDSVSVVVLTNLTRPSGSNPQGLALGIAGFYAAGVSWLSMQGIADPTPVTTEGLLREMRGLSQGRPTPERYTCRRSGTSPG
jgi:CubicO group peptidase (beta-lactamase class C family)